MNLQMQEYHMKLQQERQMRKMKRQQETLQMIRKWHKDTGYWQWEALAVAEVAIAIAIVIESVAADIRIQSILAAGIHRKRQSLASKQALLKE
jgi:hypothetical protein